MDRANLTVLTHALVTRLTIEANRVTGVECILNGKTHRVSAGREVILSLGAIHTPKVLMHPVSVMKSNCTGSELKFLLRNIFRVLDKTFSTILVLAVCGNARPRLCYAITAADPDPCQSRL